MGVVLFSGFLFGCICGLLATGILVVAGLMMTRKTAQMRSDVWLMFGAAFVVLLLLCILGLSMYPFPEVSPGSDYDVAMKNLFLKGLGYCASPGVAALVAALAARIIALRT